MYTNGLTKDEYIGLLKECGMCTKKWTYAKIKMFNEKEGFTSFFFTDYCLSKTSFSFVVISFISTN